MLFRGHLEDLIGRLMKDLFSVLASSVPLEWTKKYSRTSELKFEQVEDL